MKKTGILVWPGLFWILAFLLPFSAVLIRAGGAPGAMREITLSPYYRRVFLFTVQQAALSTLFSVLIGIPGAALIARYRFPGRRLLKSLTTVPFVLPPILAVLGFILVFGNSGLVNGMRRLFVPGTGSPWRILYSLKAIIMAHVFYNFPLTLRIVGDSWSSLSYSPHKASKALGAGPVKTFLAVDLPRLLPSIATAALLTFIYCFMSFTIILILGGGPQFSTLEVEVYRLVKYNLDFSAGSALALLESGFILLMMSLYAFMGFRSGRWLKDESDNPAAMPVTKLQGRKSAGIFIYLGPALFLILTPLLAIAVNSFLGRATRSGGLSFTLSNWQDLFMPYRNGSPRALEAVGRTLILSLAAAALTTITAGLSAWYTVVVRGRAGRILDIMVTAPMAVSSVILGLGYLILANRIPGRPGFRLVSLLMAHTVLALPFAHRIIAERLKGISPRVRQAARSMGAGPIRSFFTMELPLAKKALITSAVFSMALSAGEMNATLILAPPGFTTIPLAIYRMIGSYDVFGACALGSILIALSAGAFFVLDRFTEENL